MRDRDLLMWIKGYLEGKMPLINEKDMSIIIDEINKHLREFPHNFKFDIMNKPMPNPFQKIEPMPWNTPPWNTPDLNPIHPSVKPVELQKYDNTGDYKQITYNNPIELDPDPSEK